jgi:predicted ATP-binding protein involved in virulence
MIKTFKVTGLNGIPDHDLKFHDDLNILTGRNGSGKTTLLKLMWYMLSPNLERTVPEIDFSEAELTTDYFRISINKSNIKKTQKVNITFKPDGQKSTEIELMADEFHDPAPLEQVENINRKIIELKRTSVFFPTFRRIEGGFSTESHRRYRPYTSRIAAGLGDSMSAYSDMMTVQGHKFVASISTADIEDLLTKQYADVSDSTNALHAKLSKSITKQIGQQTNPKTDTSRTDKARLQKANELLETIRKEVTAVEKQREELMKPFSVLSVLISNIFKDKGIRISSNLTFGETREAIQASILSAGEKQMLSFLCYNAFNRNTPIFIDEPELSLHVDWQRMLFATLLDQDTNNQFIVSTHSPFIYSKYPEKELTLHLDKGGD